MRTINILSRRSFGASLFLKAWQAMRKKEKLRKKCHLKGLELTSDEQWERINIILVIFATVLLLNTTLILAITLRMSQNLNGNLTLKRRFHFEQQVKGMNNVISMSNFK